MADETMSADEILARLRAVGERRKKASRHNIAGIQTINETSKEIRELTNEAVEGNLLKKIEIANALGLSRQQLDNILNERIKVESS